MPQRDPKITRFVLPIGKGTPDEIWVDLKLRPKAGDYIAIQEFEKDMFKYRIALLERCIEAWNLSGKDGKPLPKPTHENGNIGELEANDIVFLIGKIDEEASKLQLSNAEKKTSG